MKTKYNTVRKTSWDSLWHAVYTTGPGQEAWDRVSEDEALRIARTLPPHLPKKPLLNRRPTVIQRESEPAKGADWPNPEYLAQAKRELMSDNHGR